MNKNIKVNPDGTISPIDPSKPSSFGEPDNAMAGELLRKQISNLIVEGILDAEIKPGNNKPFSIEFNKKYVDAILSLFAQERTRLLESLRRELPEKPVYPEVMEYVAMVKNAGEHGKYDDMYDNGYNAAIDTVNQLLTKYVQRGENGE